MSHHIDTKKQYTYISKAFDPELFKKLASVNAFIAGGAISSLFTDRPINDFDIFFKTNEIEEIVDYFKKTTNWKPEFVSSLTHTYKNNKPIAFNDPCDYGKTIVIGDMKIQLVSAFFGDPQTIFNSFDFHCCMGAFMFKHNEFKFDPYFITDNMSRTLRYNYEGAANALTTLFRVEKYKKYGYTLPFEELMKIILAIKKIKLNTMKEMKEFLKLLPPGIYKKILNKELIEKPIQEMRINFNKPEGMVKYENFMNSPCNVDSIVSILTDMNSYIATMQDDKCAAVDVPFVGPQWFAPAGLNRGSVVVTPNGIV